MTFPAHVLARRRRSLFPGPPPHQAFWVTAYSVICLQPGLTLYHSGSAGRAKKPTMYSTRFHSTRKKKGGPPARPRSDVHALRSFSMAHRERGKVTLLHSRPIPIPNDRPGRTRTCMGVVRPLLDLGSPPRRISHRPRRKSLYNDAGRLFSVSWIQSLIIID
ncbi:hypothetical protein GGR52DRAFT_249921 [Hypoxylon sp. FL1284]|nr:hypothetical protein GGR52DRAFT_249921 [Hypoxylon sp. FL1284]